MVKLFKKIDVEVGIYDAQSEITRHKNGDVTVKEPFVKWVGQTGTLDFWEKRYTGREATIISAIFSDSPPENEYGDALTCAEIVRYGN